MAKVLSRDGTPIALTRLGEGPPLILVDGALCYRGFGPMAKLAQALAKDFTVITYDRRGRGESGDMPPYAVQREIEDLEALINEVGGWSYVYGISSGAALALEAANRGLPIRKLALYEAPFIVDSTRPPLANDYEAELDALLAANRRGDAIKLFMRMVGVPAAFIFLMRFMPMWSKLKAVAHTLPYDTAIVAANQRGNPLPAGRWASVSTPTLVALGGKSPAWMRNAMQALADAIPHATRLTLDGQTHMVKAPAHAPMLVQYFKA
jgi:pimeloyl-ACP methyl ester carboxylesterase